MYPSTAGPVLAAVLGAADYGVLKDVVAAAGAILAGTGAIALGWKGRWGWEPAEEDVPRGPQKVAGLLAALAIVIVWTEYRNPDHRRTLVGIVGGGGACCLIALCVYSFLIGLYTYRAGKNRTARTVIGGFVLRPAARAAVAAGGTLQAELAAAKYDPDLVWVRGGRAAAKVVFILGYVALSASGTIALASAAMLIGLTTRQPGGEFDSAVQVTRRASTLDLTGRRAVPGHKADQKVSPGVWTHQVTLRRLSADATRYVHIVGVKGNVEPDIRTDPPAEVAKRGLMEAFDLSREKLVRWDVVYDLSAVPVNTETTVTTRVTMWNAYQGETEEWSAMPIFYPTDEAVLDIRFPPDKPLKAHRLYHYVLEKSAPKERFTGNPDLTLAPGGAGLTWRVTNPKARHTYRVDWDW